MAILFLLASAACLMIGPQIHPMARAAWKLQIILSALAATSGAAIVWLLMTFLFGRVYCSCVCPVGTLSDLFARGGRRISRRLGRERTYRYRAASRSGQHVLVVYLLCLVLGIGVIPLLIEPWNIMRNISSTVNPSLARTAWGAYGFGAVIGICAGIVSLVVIAALSVWRGRFFCTRICPLGAGMGLISERSVYHLEIDRDACDACGKCEEVCRAECILSREKEIDNTRCVRCLDCAAECPREAIHFQINPNMPLTPLFRKVKKA